MSATPLAAVYRPPTRLRARQEEMRERLRLHPRPACVRKPKSVLTPIERATAAGYCMGLHNRHYSARINYHTGAEWVAFLKGWRRGQAEFKRRAAR